MNRHDDTEPLRQALHERAETLHDAPVTLDEVRSRAGGIRRRRRIAAGVGALAVVAVLAPVGLATMVGGDPADRSPVATDANGGGDATAGAGLAHLVDGRIVRADGTSFRPQVDGTPFAFAPLGDGRWVVQTYDEQSPSGTGIWVLDEQGAVLQEYAGSESPITTADDGERAVGWIDRDGGVRVLQAGSDRPVQVGDGTADTELIEVRGDCAAQSGCEVLEETSGRSGRRIARVAGGGSQPFLDDVFESLSDVSPDGRLAAGTVSVDEAAAESCSGVYDRDAGRMLWETCDASGLTFSPDGALVLGVDPFLDGANHTLNIVLDARDGAVVDEHRGTLYDEQWESASTWLSVAGTDAGQSRIVRHTVGGGTEEVAGPVDDEIPSLAAYQLQVR